MKLWFTTAFATLAHAGQKRKYDGTPYIEHPKAVARLASYYTNKNVPAIQCALLHDVVEDTWVQSWMIYLLFGKEVGQMVKDLTKVEDPKDNRAIRKNKEAERLKLIGRNSKLVKICDLLHNHYDNIHQDPNFAKVFMTEFKYLLEYSFNDCFNALVYKNATKEINKFFSK